MSKLTDIKYRIDQLDGGAFQNLCDAYLACRGYGSGYSLGMKTGTNKSAKGNPDTYFLTADGKYVFAMYTTQKDNFVNKALEDLEKCFDEDKTGLSPEFVSEIVYCHTYGRLSAGEDKSLHDFCEKHNATLTLIGLDELGYDLYLKYPRLAKDFLGVSVATGQVLTLDEFVKAHDANKMSAPLNTDFLLREKELQTAQEKLAARDVLILTGPAGVGKTRFALQLCRILAEQNSWEVVCIKNNGLELYKDLVAAFEANKEYLVFIDDANELSSLNLILNYLFKTLDGTRFIRKIIMTVRDYACRQVVNEVLEVEKPEMLKIGSFSDEGICELIKTAYGITNHLFSGRIVAIAEGNARLAMLAGKVALESGDLEAIRDATELYDHYYGKQLERISDSDSSILSAGIMAFFQVLRLDYLEPLRPVLSVAKLTEDQFISDLKSLHDLELVDLRHNKAARISDQSFSNYLIKHVFVDKKIIPLSQMIENCFSINREATISSCNILGNVFSDEATQKYLEEQINIVWDSLKCDDEKFFPFFRAFFLVRPTDSLINLKNMIDSESCCEFDVESIPFKKGNSEKNITNDFIGMLCGFKHKAQLPEAMDLLLYYYQKRPDLFEQIYSALAFQLGVDKDSLRYGYFTQRTVAEKIIHIAEENPTSNNILLFIRVAEQMLRLCFSKAEGGRKNSFTLYTMPLTAQESVFEYRRMLWEELYKLYDGRKHRKDIESLLLDYCNVHGNTIEHEIVKADLSFIMNFFGLLSPACLYHCIIAEHIDKVANQVEYDCADTLIPFLNSPKYEIYKLLNSNRKDLLQMDYQDGMERHRKQIQESMQRYSILEFQFLLDVCNECLETVDLEGGRLSFGLKYAIDALSSDHELYIKAIKAYLKADTPYDLRPDDVLNKLFSIMPVEAVKELIDSEEYSQKNKWLWAFFTELPVEQITVAWANELLAFFDHVPMNLGRSPHRHLGKIEKYECVDKDIILKASKVIVSHCEESPFVFSLYFSPMLDPLQTGAKDVIMKYEKDISLLEDIYQKCVAYVGHEDHDGVFLAEILKTDPGFLYKYLDITIGRYSASESWVNRLHILWEDDLYLQYIDRISDYVFEDEASNLWTYSYIMGHLLLHEAKDETIEERQEEWIRRTIVKYCTDKNRMYGLFKAISDHSEDRRRQALKTLLSLNRDYDLFEDLPLEASHWGGIGSMIPYMQARIDYLTSLLPLLSGLDFLKHRQRVEKDIEIWRNRIMQEEINELVRSF